MDQNQPITTDRCDLWNPLKIAYVSQEVNLRVNDGGEKMQTIIYIFLTCGCNVIAKRTNKSEEIVAGR